jgi:hypothetical protein
LDADGCVTLVDPALEKDQAAVEIVPERGELQ